MYYSFGSRNADVQILNAHLENFNIDEQIQLRCKKTSMLNKAITVTCDYKCHPACDGCSAPYSLLACKRCEYAKINISTELLKENFICADKCPNGFKADKTQNNICKGQSNIINLKSYR